MPEKIENAALSGEWKLVPVTQLKKWHRDLDACQKVMWLRGGFDPAYCMDAQDCLKEMEGVLAAPVPPAGGEVEVFAYYLHPLGDLEHGRFLMREDAKIADPSKSDHHGTVVLVDRAHVTRLQAEIAQLTETTFGQEQVIETLEARAAQKDDLLTDVYLIAKQLAARQLVVSPDDEPAKDAIAALRQKAQLNTLLPQ